MKIFFGNQVVCDRLGNLFVKHAVVKSMIEKNLSPSYAHLRSLKDLINLEFQKNEDFQLNKEAQVGDHTEAFVSPFACPITNRPLNGKYQFCVLSKCGHVFSKKGIETSQTRDVKVCYVCQKGYVDEDVITFNPNPEEKKNIGRSS